MTQGSFRLALAVAALAALWVVVYWWTPAAPRPTIAFQPSPAPPAAEPAPPEPSPRATSPTRPAVQPPSFYQHTVARDDTAQSISKRYYGTTAHWQAVMRANPKTDFQNLRAGLTIRVPVDPKNIQGRPEPADPEPPATSAGVEYVVERGDTLSGLAFRFYGRASVYKWIIEANEEQLGADGSRLRAGMKIIIPPAREGAE
ncbi:MAG: LysM peptidoglycan-binding domain-containing protein [Phycisphaerae bacterium]|nr:LysM peptidoglycan-binding domain-containing protein [Phycisphaerae bacterium]